MLSRERENALALANLLGTSEEQALEKVATRVSIFAGDSADAVALADDIGKLLERSLHVVTSGECDVEVAVGCSFRTGAGIHVAVALDADRVVVSSEDGTCSVGGGAPGLFRKIAACYAAGNIIARAVGEDQNQGLPDRFEVKFATFGVSAADLAHPISLDGSVLAGAGGVANGFMWGLTELPVSGLLTVCDAKDVATGNLNRCLYFYGPDVGSNKAEVLAARTTGNALNVVPFKGTFHDFVSRELRVKRVFTTMDSRQARRSVQSDLPVEVLDASTTESIAVVVHSHRQPTDGACLSCIYPRTAIEDEREHHIADGLGLTVEETRRGLIDDEIAKKLVGLHANLQYETIIGRAFDSVHKEQCGQGALFNSAGQQAIAPLGFVSNLAGLLLALELVRFERRRHLPPESNYMSVDPWRVPSVRARRNPAKFASCECCTSPDIQQAMRAVWPELNWPEPTATEAQSAA